MSAASLKTLRDAIKRRSFDGAYFIYGEDDYQKDDAIKQLVDLAKTEVPGTAGYLQFLLVLVNAGEAPAAGPADCDSAIAAAKAAITGKTLKGLTAAQYASTNATLTAVSTVCASDKANAFRSSAEVAAFYNG